MIDKHEGVTDWEAAARIAMARADREAEAKVIILDFVEEMRDTLTAILGACGRGKQPITMDEAIRHDTPADDEWERIKDGRYDADPIPPSDADPGL